MTTHHVSITQVAPRLLAAVRARLDVRTVPMRFSESLDQVYAAARRGELSLDGQNVFLYRETGTPWEVDADFGVGATRPFTAVGNVTPVYTPAGAVAMTTHRGGYGGLRSAHIAIREWCARHGREFTGVRWEVYGHWVADESQLTTDVYYLLADV